MATIIQDTGGELTGLLKAAGFLLSAGTALVVGFVGPFRDVRGRIRNVETRLAGLVTAVATGLIWTVLAEPICRNLIVWLAVGCGLGTVAFFIVYERTLRSRIARPTTLASFYLALATTGPVALSCTALLTILPKPIDIRITVPPAGDCFAPGALVQGTWRNLPPDLGIWLASSATNGRPLYPEDQNANVLLNGKWESSLSFQPPPGMGIFHLRAMVVNAEARKILEAYASDPARMGMPAVPNGAIIADRIALRTGEKCPSQ